MSVKKLVFSVLSLFFCFNLLYSEILQVRGYGIAKSEANLPKNQLKNTAKTASRSVAQSNVVMLNGASLIIKAGAEYELSMNGKTPAFGNLKYRKLSDIYYECIIQIDNTKYIRGKKLNRFSFKIVYDDELDLSDIDSVKSYNNKINLEIVRKLAEELSGKMNLTPPGAIRFTYLYIDRQLGSKTVSVDIIYSIEDLE